MPRIATRGSQLWNRYLVTPAPTAPPTPAPTAPPTPPPTAPPTPAPTAPPTTAPPTPAPTAPPTPPPTAPPTPPPTAPPTPPPTAPPTPAPTKAPTTAPPTPAPTAPPTPPPTAPPTPAPTKAPTPAPTAPPTTAPPTPAPTAPPTKAPTPAPTAPPTPAPTPAPENVRPNSCTDNVTSGTYAFQSCANTYDGSVGDTSTYGYTSATSSEYAYWDGFQLSLQGVEGRGTTTFGFASGSCSTAVINIKYKRSGSTSGVGFGNVGCNVAGFTSMEYSTDGGSNWTTILNYTSNDYDTTYQTYQSGSLSCGSQRSNIKIRVGGNECYEGDWGIDIVNNEGFNSSNLIISDIYVTFSS